MRLTGKRPYYLKSAVQVEYRDRSSVLGGQRAVVMLVEEQE